MPDVNYLGRSAQIAAGRMQSLHQIARAREHDAVAALDEAMADAGWTEQEQIGALLQLAVEFDLCRDVRLVSKRFVKKQQIRWTVAVHTCCCKPAYRF